MKRTVTTSDFGERKSPRCLFCKATENLRHFVFHRERKERSVTTSRTIEGMTSAAMQMIEAEAAKNFEGKICDACVSAHNQTHGMRSSVAWLLLTVGSTTAFLGLIANEKFHPGGLALSVVGLGSVGVIVGVCGLFLNKGPNRAAISYCRERGYGIGDGIHEYEYRPGSASESIPGEWREST